MSIITGLIQEVSENCSDNSLTSSLCEYDKESKEPAFQSNDQSSNVLNGSFKFTPKFLNKDFEYSTQIRSKQLDKASSSRKGSIDHMTRNLRAMKRRALKRKISIRSRQHLIPLSEELRYERGQIEDGEGSTSGKNSNLASINANNSIASIRHIVRKEIRDQLLNLKRSESLMKKPKSLESRQSKHSLKFCSSTENFTENQSANLDFPTNSKLEIGISSPTTDQNNYDNDDDKSIKSQIGSGESRNISEPLDSDVPELISKNLFLPDDTGMTCTQKSFRSILQLQIEIWRKLLELKENAEILEKVVMSRHFDVEDVRVPSIEKKMSSMKTTDSISPSVLQNSSLKVVYSQMKNDHDGNASLSYYPSNDYEGSSFSCYSKMNEIEHRLSDVEFRMASIHQILQSVRQQQYKELKSRQVSFVKKQKRSKTSPPEVEITPEQIGDSKGVNKTISDINSIDHKSDPTSTNVKVVEAMLLKKLNPYDESYYEWRQYHMNLLRYKKSERTISLNRRPTLNMMKPPILKYFRDIENNYRIRVKKPFFIITPSRTNLICNRR